MLRGGGSKEERREREGGAEGGAEGGREGAVDEIQPFSRSRDSSIVHNESLIY